MKTLAGAFASGLIFALGLGLAGMTRPTKVLAFLNLAGAWDPSLALVMVFGIAVFAAAHLIIKRRNATIFGAPLQLPPRGKVDRKLLLGAAIFGAGWGLGGFCPGPALVGASSLATEAVYFCIAMIVGQLAAAHGVRSNATQPSQTKA